MQIVERKASYADGGYSMLHISVTIKVADTWPSSKDLAARNAVIDALDAVQIGRPTGAGGGMGEMDFSYDVEVESFARQEITTTMQKLMPGAEYRIRCTQ